MTIMKMPFYLVSLLTLLMAFPVHATWYGENVADGSDIMMMDIRWPWWPEFTYYANWNVSTNPPSNISGYGGFTGGVVALEPDFVPNLDKEVQAAYRPGSVWTFWGSNDEGEPVRVVAASRFTYPSQYGGEGSSGALGSLVWPFIQQNRWYTMLMRVWTPLGQGDAKYSYMGRWTKDVEANCWYLYGIVRLPVKATSFRGNAGFLEDFAGSGRSLRAMHRRLGYYCKEGQWFKSDTVSYNLPPASNVNDPYVYVNKIENNRVLAMGWTANPKLKPVSFQGEPLKWGETHSFTVEQPDQPTLDQPAIEKVQVKSNGSQVWVSWQVPDSASPQLAYKVEVFDNSDCLGKPIVVREERMPIVRNVLLAAESVKPTVRVSLIDIFDQAAKPVVVQAKKIGTPQKPVTVKTSPGLRYELFFKDKDRHVNVHYPTCEKLAQNRNERHFWISLDELKDGRLAQQGTCRGFDRSIRGNRPHAYAFRYRGLLQIPATGMYLFYIKGTDGYRINLDGNEAFAWDGLHGPEERTFMLNLAKGDHIIAVDYFFDRMTPFLQLEWEGPGFSRQDIPTSALRHEIINSEPQIDLVVKNADDDGKVLFLENGKVRSGSMVSIRNTNKSGFVSIRAEVKSNGHAINKVQLFLDDMRITDIAGDEFKRSNQRASLPQILLPAGKHTIWARVFYNGNYTFDSQFLPVTIEAGKVSGWSVGIAGELDSEHNIVQMGSDAFSFVGEGEYVIHRKIKGDFTLTCKVDECLGLKGEPVNGTSWVGLSAREHADKRRWGRQFGLMQTARHGLRATPDYPDLAGSRMSVQTLPKDRSWLRIVRQGNQWTGWVSSDGKSWDFAAAHFIPASQEMGAGIVFRALPQDSQMYFRAAVSNVSLTSGVPKDWQKMKIVTEPAAATKGARITGVVVAPSDPSVLVLRTSNRGLLRSVNAGKTWRPANGKLKGDANAVRSVAIHPTNPDIMLRAAGCVVGNDMRSGSDSLDEGGLYKTSDGGRSWEKLVFNGDFDGKGPSTICGEVIVFIPHQPETILVGCETLGLMRSEDGGKTWKQLIPPGERITAVKVNRYYRNKDGQVMVHVLTCPDQFIPVLGRGESAFSSEEKLARHYISYNDGKDFCVQHERTDLGYFNLSTNNQFSSTLIYGTSHGLLFSFDNGKTTYLLMSGLQIESLRPFIAVAGVKPSSNAWVRTMAQALNPAEPNRISRCDINGTSWRWQYHTNNLPAAYIAIVPASILPNAPGDNWWIVGNDGLYYMEDSGATLKKVLE